MSTIKKRKADEDDNSAPIKSHTKKNRPSADNNQSHTTTNASSPVITQPHYSSLSFSTKPSSSTDHSHIWTPSDSLNSSLSSASSMTDYDSMSSSYGIVSKSNSSRTTNDNLSMAYNPTYQQITTEEHGVKREISPPLNGTPLQTKKIRTDGVLPTPPPSGGYSAAAARMMEKMGYDKTRGIGLNAQGPTKLIEESKQKGRRGLGFSFRDFNNETAEWDFDNDPAPIEEEVVWCPPSDDPDDPLDLDEMRQWIQIGPKKKVIEDETDFCDEEVLRAMLIGKNVFDELPQKEMEEARARSNVYETIGPSIFLNRAAVKIANIDLVFGRMFTEPKSPNERASLVQPDEPFYFADVCAGPGGFSEYILWKKQWRAKGFGFTLKGKSDFSLFKFVAGYPETFDPHYGVKEIEGDGDIFKSENIDAFQTYVYKCTMNNGVHIMMADGGFSVEGQENIQEILSKQLYLCQFLTALSILRPGGHFVCKLFDLFTPFSVGLVYLMYRTFDKVTIHKPVTSRPANSERYIICKSLRRETRDLVRTYMYEINALLNKYKVDSESDDVLSIVPMEILRSNDNFYQFICNSNNELGETQIRNLRKIRAFVSNALLRDDRQNEVRTRCLQYWEIPDEARQKPRRLVCTELQQTLLYQLGHGMESVLFNIPKPFKNSVLDRIHSLFDYRCVLSLGEPVLLLSCGRSLVSALRLKDANKRWDLLERTPFKIELPPYTLLLAELVKEQFSDTRNTRQRSAVYIIDAYFISNENMLSSNGRPTVFMDRYRALKLFEKTINKPARIDLVPIRISEQLRFEQMDSQFEKLCSPGSLEQIDSERLVFTNMDITTKPRVSIAGLWIFKFVQYPWTILLSKTRQMKYFHNQANRTSTETVPSDASHAAGLKPMLEHSFYWDFQNHDDPVQKSNFIAFIQGKNRSLQSQPQQQTTQN